MATLQVDTEEGDYELSATDPQIEPVPITVGAPRPSGQDRLLAAVGGRAACAPAATGRAGRTMRVRFVLRES